MSYLLEKIRQEARALSIQEQEVLARELTEGFHEIAPDVVDAWVEESGKRLEAFRSSGNKGITLDAQRAEVESLYPSWKL